MTPGTETQLRDTHPWPGVGSFVAVSLATGLAMSAHFGADGGRWSDATAAVGIMTALNVLGYVLASARVSASARADRPAFMAVSGLAALACLLSAAVVTPVVTQATGLAAAATAATVAIAAVAATSVFRLAGDVGWLGKAQCSLPIAHRSPMAEQSGAGSDC